MSENIFSVIFLVFSIGLVLVRRLRERQHTDGPGPGRGGGGGDGGGGGGGGGVEGDRQTVGGSVLQNQDVIFPSETDHGGDNDEQLLTPREPAGNYHDRRLPENYSNVSFRQQPDPSLAKYASDQWDERTHIKLNPLYQTNYS